MRPVLATTLAVLFTCSFSASAQQPKRVRIAPELAAQYTRREVIPPPTAAAGNAKFKVVVSREGNVVDLSLMRGDSAVVRAASKALRQWKYSPYFVDGEPVEFETEVTIRVSHLATVRGTAVFVNGNTGAFERNAADVTLKFIDANGKQTAVQTSDIGDFIAEAQPNKLCVRAYDAGGGELQLAAKQHRCVLTKAGRETRLDVMLIAPHNER